MVLDNQCSEESDTPPGYNFFCEPETIPHEKVDESALIFVDFLTDEEKTKCTF